MAPSFQDLAKKYGQFYSPRYRIRVEGVDLLKDRQMEIFDVKVDARINQAASFTFTVGNRPELDKRKFPLLDPAGAFRLGAKVEIALGYTDGGLKTMMKGYIASVSVSFPASGVSRITVQGFDYLHVLTKVKRQADWGSSDRGIKYSDVVRRILEAPEYRSYALRPTVIEDTGVEHRQFKQEGTDFDFLLNTLTHNKPTFEVFALGDDFHFRKPFMNLDDYITELVWGQSLHQFNPQVDTSGLVERIEVRHWNPDSQEAIVGVAERGSEHGADRGDTGAQVVGRLLPGLTELIYKPVTSQRQAEEDALEELNSRGDAFVTGSGECIGLPEMEIGKNVKISGLGQPFSKVYYLDQVAHTLNSSGYSTSFGVKEKSL